VVLLGASVWFGARAEARGAGRVGCASDVGVAWARGVAVLFAAGRDDSCADAVACSLTDGRAPVWAMRTAKLWCAGSGLVASARAGSGVAVGRVAGSGMTNAGLFLGTTSTSLG
jgi:hypothetical protein